MTPNILREYTEGDMQVTEYTRDGETVSHVVKVPANSEIPEGETIPVQPTFEQRLRESEEKQALMQSALDELIFSGGGL